MTKQAAQKRFVPQEPENAEPDLRIFARYVDSARAVIVRAQEQAHRHAAPEIAPGHILLALLEDDDTHQFLGSADPQAVRTAVTDALGTGTAATDGPVPFSSASRKALNLGHREAVRLHSDQIHPLHIMLGTLAMTAEPDIAAAAAAGLSTQQVEATIPGAADTP